MHRKSVLRLNSSVVKNGLAYKYHRWRLLVVLIKYHKTFKLFSFHNIENAQRNFLAKPYEMKKKFKVVDHLSEIGLMSIEISVQLIDLMVTRISVLLFVISAARGGLHACRLFCSVLFCFHSQ